MRADWAGLGVTGLGVVLGVFINSNHTFDVMGWAAYHGHTPSLYPTGMFRSKINLHERDHPVSGIGLPAFQNSAFNRNRLLKKGISDLPDKKSSRTTMLRAGYATLIETPATGANIAHGTTVE